MPYSSGTTGLPKGVMLTHYKPSSPILLQSGVLGVTENDTLLGVLPFFHIYGMVVIMNLSLHAPARLWWSCRASSSNSPADAAELSHHIRQCGPADRAGVAKNPIVDQYNLSSVRTLFSGAAPLGASVAEAASNRIGL